MTETVQTRRTTEELVELARRYAPEHRQELSVVLREILGDMESFQEGLDSPPQKEHVGRLISEIKVDCGTLAHKCQQLIEILDILSLHIPDEVYLSTLPAPPAVKDSGEQKA